MNTDREIGGIFGTKLFNLIHDVRYVIRVTCRENHE